VKEVIEDRWPTANLKLLDDDATIGQLTEAAGEATFIQPVTPENFEFADFAIFACDAAFTLRHWKSAQEAGCSIVDLSGALTAEPSAHFPMFLSWLGGNEHSPARTPDLSLTGFCVPHPIAMMTALLIQRVQDAGKMLFASAQLFRPVSDVGKAAMDELHLQTVQLLAFQSQPRDIFDQQLTFNLLTQYGGEAKVKMKDLVLTVRDQLRMMLGNEALLPAFQMIQAAIFHGQSVALYVEYAESADFHSVVASLEGEHVKIALPDEEPPNHVSTVGQDAIELTVRQDANRANGYWIWAVADNLRFAALMAADCVALLSASRPSRNIQ
jgi:aspartate-semialdehyde dehydrogenase